MLLVPPLAEVEHFVQALRLIKQLAFVNQQAGVTRPILNGIDDLVERNNLIPEIRVEDPQRQKSTRQLSRNRNLEIGDVIRRGRLARYDDRSVVIANRSAMRKKSVLLVNVRVSMKADRGDIVRATHRFLVESLNVFEKVLEIQIPSVQFVRREAIEHERVVGIR